MKTKRNFGVGPYGFQMFSYSVRLVYYLLDLLLALFGMLFVFCLSLSLRYKQLGQTCIQLKKFQVFHYTALL